MKQNFRFSALYGAVALLLSAGTGPVVAQAGAGPFDTLAGSWAGTGSITLGSGDRERIRCRVSYDVETGGRKMQQDLRCASDSYRFDMSSDVNYANGAVTGRWSDRGRNKHGTITGRAAGQRIEVLAETAGFAVVLTLTTNGDRQSVMIDSKSPELRDVSINLRRSGD